jgi:hypothetical protein
LSFYEAVGAGVLKIEEAELEVFCTDCTGLVFSTVVLNINQNKYE